MVESMLAGSYRACNSVFRHLSVGDVGIDIIPKLSDTLALGENF